MKRPRSGLAGLWRIHWMKVWGPESLDMLGPAMLELGRSGRGAMSFVAVQAWLDCAPGISQGVLDFSWEGTDDGTPVSGRGWVRLGRSADEIEGHFFFHCGDSSPFKASRVPKVARKEVARRRSPK